MNCGSVMIVVKKDSKQVVKQSCLIKKWSCGSATTVWNESSVRCEEKKGYATRHSAERAMTMIWKSQWLNNNRKKPCASYKCNLCAKWHLTSQPQRRKVHKEGS